jgi:polyketide synthase-associated protein
MSRIVEQLKADLDLNSLPVDLLGYEVVNKLALKGFCVLSNNFETGDLEKAVSELQEFDHLHKWEKVNSTIQEGLLGAEGSARIAELESPEEEHRDEGDTIDKLDQTITQFGFRIEPYLERLNFSVTHRSHAVVNQAGEPDEEVTPLNNFQVMKWLPQFIRHKIMVLVFIGPNQGTLELKPFDTDDAEMCEIQTPPGTIVILRPDIMSHKHFSPGKSFVISSFFLQESVGKSGKRAPQGGWPLIPAAKELDDWMMERLKQYKERHSEDSVWDPEIPTDWRNAMNHMYHKGQMMTVRGAACKFPFSEDVGKWFQVQSGGIDYLTTVPFVRWDHTEVWDSDPESWRRGYSYCRHGAFMDGVELFDCKLFSMSPNEAKAMDPHQRLILEVGYGALHQMGLRKNTLNNTHCGVYVGCGNSEWSMMPKEQSEGAFGATGGALSISSGRFSFTLGLKGPSMTLDTEASSGSVCMYMAAESCQRKGRATPNDLAIGIAAHLLLAAAWWPSMCAQGELSQQGRCMTFDSSADGYVRGDGLGSAVLKPMAENVDGDYVNEDESRVGTIAGAMMNNSGYSASLTAPAGPAEQEAIVEAIRNASVDPYDVDSIEAHGVGKFLDDAIEVSSHERSHRHDDTASKPLTVVSLKSSQGNQMECASMASFLKVLYSCQWGMTVTNLHLRQVNAHIEYSTSPCNLSTENLEQSMASSFVGHFARGQGGSNVYLLLWGQVNTDKVPPPAPAPARDAIIFWPGGGGMLPPEQRPESFYSIVGSWSKWEKPQAMEAEGDGRFGFTIVLGVNRWEQFQIWLDGDSTKVLHPRTAKASKDFPVLGPETDADEDVQGLAWMIDGRGELCEYEDSGTVQTYALESPDKGRQGDMYRVHLCIVGKWRTVSWEKIQALPISDAAKGTWDLDLGSYYITGAFNNWEFEEMTPDTSNNAVFRAKIKLTRAGSEFQIVRNKDFAQVIYPDSPYAGPESNVYGPDDLGDGLFWSVEGSIGDHFTIEFQRIVELDDDKMGVSWLKHLTA